MASLESTRDMLQIVHHSGSAIDKGIIYICNISYSIALLLQ
jgi:hypothetical protein